MSNTATTLPPDIEIARRAKMLPIEEIAAKLDIGDDDLEHYGKDKAKISLDLYRRLDDKPHGQAGAGDGHHADARRRRQDHDQHRPVRRPEPHRQEDDRLPARAVAGPVLRHERRRRRRRLRPGRADGRHQPALHRRLPRHRTGPQPPVGDARQPHPPRQPVGHRPAADRVAARRRHERPGAARHHRRPRRREQLRAARVGLRHHRRLRSHGRLLPLRIAPGD